MGISTTFSKFTHNATSEELHHICGEICNKQHNMLTKVTK